MTSLVRRAAAVSLMTLLAAGCEEAGTGSVRGTITVAGRPLPRGSITFLPAAGDRDPVTAAVIDGVYDTGPMPTGPARITIMHSTHAPAAAGGDRTSPRLPADAPRVPAKYHSPDTSGLSLPVKPGANTFDYDVRP
jgi:hypothetical protein